MIVMKEERKPELTKPWYTIKEIISVSRMSRSTVLRYINILNLPSRVFPTDQKTLYYAQEDVSRILIIATEPWRVDELRYPQKEE